MKEHRSAEAFSGVAVALALILVFWVLGTGGAARVAWLQLLGAVVILALVFRRTAVSPERSNRTVTLLSLVFVALAALSLLTSVNRGMTVSAVAALVAGVAIMHAAGMVSHRTATWLAAAQVVLLLPIAASAVLEPLGMGWLPAHDYFPGRAMANMGGPGPLGALLAAAIPVATAFFLTSSRRILTIVLGVIAALLLAALTATFSRAALLATVVGFVVLVVTLMRVSASHTGDRPGLRRRVVRRALVVILMAAIIVPAYNAAVRAYAPHDYDAGTRPGTQTFELVRQIEGTGLTNSDVRRLCWRTAAGMVAGHPLTGVGAGCFGVAAEKVLPEGLKQVSASRGHIYHFAYNDYLQMGSELGVPALIAFVALLLAVLGTAKAARAGRETDAPTNLPRIAALSGIAAALAALLTQALIDFPLHLPSHQTLLWVDLGLVTALAAGTGLLEAGSKPRWSAARVVTAAVAVLLSAAMAVTAARSFLAERNAVAAMHLRKAGELEGAIKLAGRSTELAPHEHAYWVLLAETANEAASTGVAPGRTRPMMFDAYRQAALTYPHHAPTYGRTGALYLSNAEAVPGAVDSAEVHLRRAVALNPYYADPHTNLGTVLTLKGDHEGATAELLQAAGLDAVSAAPLFNLGNLESSTGRISEAEAHYRAALVREPNHYGALVNLSALLISEGRLAEAGELLHAALHVDPESEQAWALLSATEEAGP